MKTATGLALVAIGAILAFAVKGHPSFLNIQIVGWVIILTGIAGMAIPRRGYGWMRRRMVLRRGPAGRPVVHRAEEQRYPPYVALNSGSVMPGTTVTTDVAAADGVAEAVPGEVTSDPPTIVEPEAGPAACDPARVMHPDAEQRAAERAAADWATAERAVADWEAAEQGTPPGHPRPAEQVVEEYIEE
jgi:hypothetical protein